MSTPTTKSSWKECLRRMDERRAERAAAHAVWRQWTRPRAAMGQAKLGVRVDPLRGAL